MLLVTGVDECIPGMPGPLGAGPASQCVCSAAPPGPQHACCGLIIYELPVEEADGQHAHTTNGLEPDFQQTLMRKLCRQTSGKPKNTGTEKTNVEIKTVIKITQQE